LEFTQSGRYTIEFRSWDKLGNVESVRVFGIWVDLEQPNSQANIVGEPDDQGRYAPGAFVEFSAFDPPLSDGSEGSGVEFIEYAFDLSGPWNRYITPLVFEDPGTNNLYYRSLDVAGNAEEIHSLNIEIVSDAGPPLADIFADPMQLWPPNNKLVPVRLYGTAIDPGSGIQYIHIEVVDEHGEYEPVVQDILPEDIIDGNWERTIELMASRRGNDKDGRTYTIIMTAMDNLGNAITKEIEVIVPHDQGN
jgi:sialidase-1